MTMGMEQRKVVDGYAFQFRNKLTDAADDGDSIAWTVGTVTRTDGGVVDIDDAVSTLNLQDYYHGAGNGWRETLTTQKDRTGTSYLIESQSGYDR